jgi:hypothetical protein
LIDPHIGEEDAQIHQASQRHLAGSVGSVVERLWGAAQLAFRHTGADGGLGLGVTAPYYNPSGTRCNGNRWLIVDDFPNAIGDSDTDCTAPC